MDLLDLQIQVEECIRATVAQTAVRLFWPDQFVEAGMGTRDEVLEALRGLVNTGKLVCRAQVRSSNGHVCWEGTPNEFVVLRPFRCTDVDCDEVTEAPHAHAVVYFKLDERWRKAVEDEKKKPTLLACVD